MDKDCNHAGSWNCSSSYLNSLLVHIRLSRMSLYFKRRHKHNGVTVNHVKDIFLERPLFRLNWKIQMYEEEKILRIEQAKNHGR